MLLSGYMAVVVVVVVTATRAETSAKLVPEVVILSPKESAKMETRGNAEGVPADNAEHLTRRRSLDFDGWFPMDVSNPMSDDPTVAYQPPRLERVHFSNEPILEKPLYPVRPENPTVFVMRSEMQEPKYHSVYGTENIEYYHINPQSNTVRAFRSPSFSVGEVSLVNAQTEATTTSTVQPGDEGVNETSSSPPETNLEIPKKVEGFSDKSDHFFEESETSDKELSEAENPDYEKEIESDQEGAFSEIRATVIQRPDLIYLLRNRDNKFSERTIAQPAPQTPAPARRRQDTPSASRSGPALYELLGNTPRRSKIGESPYLGSATDSAGASFVRQIPPPNFRYSQRTASSIQTPVTARPRVRESSARKPVATGYPWYLIDTRSSPSSRRREPSIASYIIPETLSSDNKVHYKPNGPVSYVDKEKKTLSDLIDNPHLDDHMNSYKPTLTANSLSELLQIFRYTQVTDVPNGSATEEPVTPREFRYTRPTEETPTTDILPTNYRYTPSPGKFSDPTTEAGITKKPAVAYPDAVADTNSLDGYLFSDSVASPEYASPQARPNAVVAQAKNVSLDKGVARGTSKVKINSNLVQRTTDTTSTPKEPRVIFPGPAPSNRFPVASPQYVIYQGHSKVKVFGVNSAEDNGWSKFDLRDIFITSSPISTSSNTTPAPPPSTTSTTITTTHLYSPITTSAPTSTSLVPLPKANATLSSAVSPPEEQTTSVPVTDPTPSDTTTAANEEYDYYYADDDYGVTDLAFGDYQTEHLGQPLVYISSQVPPPPNVAYLAHPPLHAPAGSTQDLETFPDQLAQNSHHLEDTFPQVLSAATAIKQAEIPVVSLDELLDQQPDHSTTQEMKDVAGRKRNA